MRWGSAIRICQNLVVRRTTNVPTVAFDEPSLADMIFLETRARADLFVTPPVVSPDAHNAARDPASQSSSTSAMGASASKQAEVKPKKICCACPITKQARDACLPENDEEKCKYLIDAHLRCLRDEGFDV